MVFASPLIHFQRGHPSAEFLLHKLTLGTVGRCFRSLSPISGILKTKFDGLALRYPNPSTSYVTNIDGAADTPYSCSLLFTFHVLVLPRVSGDMDVLKSSHNCVHVQSALIGREMFGLQVLI